MNVQLHFSTRNVALGAFVAITTFTSLFQRLRAGYIIYKSNHFILCQFLDCNFLTGKAIGRGALTEIEQLKYELEIERRLIRKETCIRRVVLNNRL